MRSYRFTFLSILLVGLIIFLQYQLWFETGGIIEMLRLRKQLALQIQENDKLKQHNELLLKQVQYLQANKEAVEARARQELGMVKKGEKFYQVVKMTRE